MATAICPFGEVDRDVAVEFGLPFIQAPPLELGMVLPDTIVQAPVRLNDGRFTSRQPVSGLGNRWFRHTRSSRKSKPPRKALKLAAVKDETTPLDDPLGKFRLTPEDRRVIRNYARRERRERALTATLLEIEAATERRLHLAKPWFERKLAQLQAKAQQGSLTLHEQLEALSLEVQLAQVA